MSPEIWQLAQVIMWVIGIQTTILMAVFGFFWSNLNKKIDKLDEKLTDVDRRLCRLEGAFASKDCCMIKDERQMKKAE